MSREFVMLCGKLNLLSEKLVAIDGSKLKAVNSRDKNFTRAKIKRRLRDVEQAIERISAFVPKKYCAISINNRRWMTIST